MVQQRIRVATLKERERVLDVAVRRELEHADLGSGCWVAVLDRFPAVLGWIVWKAVPEGEGLGARVWSGFAAETHRATCFRGLMERAAGEMRSLGIQKAVWGRWLRDGEKDGDWLASEGFEADARILDLSMDFWKYHEALSAWMRKFGARLGQVAGIQFRPLDESWVPEVRRLAHRERLVGAEALDRAILGTGRRERLDYELSTVAIREDGEVVGLLVATWSDDGPEVHLPARWIAPAYRGTSVYPVMTSRSMEACALRRPPAGMRFRFEADPEQHPETVHFCRRRGGETLGSWVRWAKRLGEAGGGEVV